MRIEVTEEEFANVLNILRTSQTFIVGKEFAIKSDEIVSIEKV